MKWQLYTATLLTVSAFALNQEPAHSATLNQSMSIQEQKDTGVDQLNKQQRQNLETFLQNYHLKAQRKTTSKKTVKVSQSTLSLNIDEGAFIQLEDGTVWEIDPTYRDIAAGWLLPVLIVVEENPGSSYPYKLYNTKTKHTIEAKKSNLNYASKGVPIAPSNRADPNKPFPQVKGGDPEVPVQSQPLQEGEPVPPSARGSSRNQVGP
ncbi:MAG: hypothetical protein MRY21_05560 [Simkaniaceae bacterium]|nr:hypothetical protein [Simkaniaceae bacterium]